MAILDFLSRKLDASDYETIGINISEKSIFTELAFYIAVSYYSESISNCEFKTCENGEEVKKITETPDIPMRFLRTETTACF